MGTGPYTVDYWDFNTAELSLNTNYFFCRGKVPKIVFKLYDNADALYQAIRKGKIDVALDMGNKYLLELKENDDIFLSIAEDFGFSYVGFNCWKSPSSRGNNLILDTTVRKAISYGIDKSKIIEEVYFGHGTRGSAVFPPGNYYRYNVGHSEFFSVLKARDLLEKAGYRDRDGDGIYENPIGERLTFTLLALMGGDEEKIAKIIAYESRLMGVEITVLTVNAETLDNRLSKGDFDMFVGKMNSTMEPMGIMEMFTTERIGSSNYSRFSNKEYDRLFKEFLSEASIDTRGNLVMEMSKIIYDQKPYVILAYEENVQAIRKDVWKGYSPLTTRNGCFMNASAYNYLNLELKNPPKVKE